MAPQLIRIILSGGSGKRLWPLSTEETPKQYLSFPAIQQREGHLLKQIVDCDIGVDATVIVASIKDKARFESDFASGALNSKVDVLYEECRRDTSCAILTACSFVNTKYQGANVIVIPSDNIIDETTLKTCIKHSLPYCGSSLITFGVTPTFPSTLYGYIQTGDPYDDKLCRVRAFHEKPTLATAQRYLTAGTYLWNSGIFLSSCRYFLDLFSTYSVNFTTISDYHACKSISFDIDVVEKIKPPHAILVCEYDGIWIDVGNHMSVYSSYKQALVKEGDVRIVDVPHALLLNKTNIPVKVIGLDNVIVILTPEGLLISDMNLSHRVKDVL